MRANRPAAMSAAILIFTAVTPSLADQNGVMQTGPEYPCASDKVASILEVCKAVKDVLPFVQCPALQTKCYKARQEIFTGLTGETASPTNIKTWNGQGVSGQIYQSVGLCLLRDLAKAPMKSRAETSLPAGTIAADSIVDYMSFDKQAKVFKGSHRLRATAPALGELDLMTQTFTARAVDSPISGKTVGQYAVTGAHALDFEADAGLEGFNFELEGIVISTPYGTVTPKPYVNVGRASFWSLSPYGGAAGLTMNPGGFQTTDVYGRLKGQSVASALNPTKLVSETPGIMRRKYCGIILQDKSHCLVPNPVGWDSQLMLGSRNVDPKASAWKAPAGQTFPLRPDGDIKTARGEAETVPGGFAKAGIKIEYDILGMLPQALISQSVISVPERKIFVDPNVWVGYGSQFNFWNAQASVWNPALTPPPPAAAVTPFDVESIHSMRLFGGSTVAGRYALDAGLDLRINFHLDLCCWLDDIDFDIINIHPRAPLAEEIKSATKPADREAGAMTSALEAVKTGKRFQLYQTLTGGVVDGFKHLIDCFAEEAPPEKAPPPVTYKKGDPKDLIKNLDMQCNICIGHADFTYVDVKTQNPLTFEVKTIKGSAGKYPFVSDAALPASEKWTCGGPLPARSIAGPLGTPDPSKIKTKAEADAYNKAAMAAAKNSIKNLGCFDQCRVNQATGQWDKIVKSAKTLYAEGGITGTPKGCH